MSTEAANIQLTMTQARATIELGDCLERLIKNSDFQKLIMKGYLEDEAVRLVLTRSKPGMVSADKQADTLRAIDGISEFNQYLMRIDLFADLAIKALEDASEAQAELDTEGAE